MTAHSRLTHQPAWQSSPHHPSTKQPLPLPFHESPHWRVVWCQNREAASHTLLFSQANSIFLLAISHHFEKAAPAQSAGAAQHMISGDPNNRNTAEQI